MIKEKKILKAAGEKNAYAEKKDKNHYRFLFRNNAGHWKMEWYFKVLKEKKIKDVAIHVNRMTGGGGSINK